MKGHLFEKGAENFPEAIKAEGVFLYTADGKKYLDFAAATFNLSLGYNHPEVTEAVIKQIKEISYASSSFKLKKVHEFSEKLIKLCPKGFTRVHPKSTGGSIANEGAIKAALKITKKNDIMSYFFGYHGQSYLTQAITGFDIQRKNLPFIGLNIIRIPFPYCYRCFYGKKYPSCKLACFEKIEKIIKVSATNGPACFIMEPILGIGGCIVPPKAYVKKLSDFCNEKGIVIIMDEVMTGIGRTGKMFGFEHFDIKPNIITLAKGLGGSGFGSAAIVAEEKFSDLTEYEHSFTATSFLIGAAAASKTLDIISKPAFLEQVIKMGKIVRKELKKMEKEYYFIGDVRGKGLMQGFEIVKKDNSPDPKRAKRIVKNAFKKGLIIKCYAHALMNTILITPALIISEKEIKEGMKILKEVLKHEKNNKN